MAKLRWAIIGGSNIFEEFMLEAINFENQGEVTSVFSNTPERARYLANLTENAKALSNLDELDNESFDIAYICGHNAARFEIAKKLISAGKNCLLEKPVALDLEQANELKKLAVEHNAIVATNHHLRFSPSNRKIKELLSERVIGEIKTIRISHSVGVKDRTNWRLTDKINGGCIYDITTHNYDLLSYLIEQPISPLYSVAQKKDGVVINTMTLARSEGINIFLHEGFNTPSAPNRIEFLGSNGALIGENTLSQKPVGQVLLLNNEEEQNINFKKQSLYINRISNLIEHMRSNGETELECTLADGIKSLQFAKEVYRILD